MTAAPAPPDFHALAAALRAGDPADPVAVPLVRDAVQALRQLLQSKNDRHVFRAAELLVKARVALARYAAAPETRETPPVGRIT